MNAGHTARRIVNEVFDREARRTESETDEETLERRARPMPADASPGIIRAVLEERAAEERGKS